MKSLLSALVITAASILPVSAGIHDFNPANAAPSPTQRKAQVGEGQCLTSNDSSEICYIRTSPKDYSISILDVAYPGKPAVVQIDCSTGAWGAIGPVPKDTLDLYMANFCPTYG